MVETVEETQNWLEEAKRESIKSSMGQVPNAEPTLAQLDMKSLEELMDACDGFIKVENDEGKEVYQKACLYPDIKIFIRASLSHLEGTSNFSWEEAKAHLWSWEELLLNPLVDKYSRDDYATNILYCVYHNKERMISDSMYGRRQEHIERSGGGHKVLEFLTGGGNEGRRGLFK